MAAVNGDGAAAAKGPPKGDDKKRDDLIVKVTGVAIATGIAYSVYKSVVVGKKEEQPFGSSPKSEPFHEQISIEKPEALSRSEAGVKDFASGVKEKTGGFASGVKEKTGEFASGLKEKAGEFKGGVAEMTGELKEKTGELKGEFAEKTGELKGGIKEKTGELKGFAEHKGKDVKYAAEGKGHEVKDAVEEGKEKAAVQEKKSEQWWSGLFGWLGGNAKEEKNEVAAKAEKVKEDAQKTVEGGEMKAEANRKNFFDKADDQLIKGKDDVQKSLAAAEANVEKAGAAVVHKVQKLAPGGKSHGGKPKKGLKEYGIVRGDTLWSISRRFGVSIDEIKSENGIWNADYIVAGDTLSIPK